MPYLDTPETQADDHCAMLCEPRFARGKAAGMEIDWARSSGAASVACGILGLGFCPGVFILAGFLFGVLGLWLGSSRGYKIVAAVGLGLCGLNVVLFIWRVAELNNLLTVELG